MVKNVISFELWKLKKLLGVGFVKLNAPFLKWGNLFAR